MRKYRALHREDYNAGMRDWRKKNSEHYRKWWRDFELKNKNARKEKSRSCRARMMRLNPSLVRERERNKQAKQRQRPEVRILGSLRARCWKALQGGRKESSTRELLGCSCVELRIHLEKHFRLGMSWENYGIHGWHIDHIKPCASFDLTDPAQQKQCFHFSNLQPLWRLENLAKGNSCPQPSA